METPSGMTDMKFRIAENEKRTRLFGLLACCLLLSNCGFVTAPLALASAEVASTTVKAADYGLEQGRTAAIYVRNQGTEGAKVTVEFLGTMVRDMRDSLRVNPLPEQGLAPLQRTPL
mgnify:FL=1